MANDKWEDFRAANRANWDERVAFTWGPGSMTSTGGYETGRGQAGAIPRPWAT
jgi:hypothetical protein